jgi:hypothetical protein
MERLLEIVTDARRHLRRGVVAAGAASGCSQHRHAKV